MKYIKNLFYKLFPSFDTRPIALVYYIDFVNKKLINIEKCIYSENKEVAKKAA